MAKLNLPSGTSESAFLKSFAKPVPTGQAAIQSTAWGSNTPNWTNAPGTSPGLENLAVNTQQKQSGGWYDGVQYWAPGQGPTNNPPAGNGGDGGGQPDYSQEISEGYAPALSALDQAISAAQGGATSQEESVGRNYASGIEKTAAESAQLTGDTTEQQTAFNKIIRSAYEEAVRAFNALNQQRVARFGGGSSAGGAVGELAQQEFFRQQGNVTEQQTTGNLQFAKEFANIGRYIGQKKTDLENWKLDAVGQIKQNLTDTLVAIAQNRGQIESNKTRDKLAALQTARENVQRVSDADTAFRQNLALTSIGQAQEIAGRAFTPAEINAQLTAWGIPLRGISRGGGQGTTAPTGLPGGQQQDEFGNLINA